MRDLKSFVVTGFVVVWVMLVVIVWALAQIIDLLEALSL